MAIAHDALTARHPLAIEAIEGVDLKGVSAFEEDGNWLVAGEEYSRLETRQPATDLRARAQLLVRSATCLDIAGQHFPAARAYSNAAGVLHALQEWQAAGELRSRGARLYLRGGHPFLAGTEWMAAAREFGMLGNTSIRSVDNIPPVPAGAAGNTIAGRCLEEAGRAFLTCPGTEAKWACGAFWSAAEHYERTFPSPNIQTFEAYREALAAGIKQYGSLAPEDTRDRVP